jgi:hypothetical protein
MQFVDMRQGNSNFDQYMPALFISPIARDVSAQMIGDAVNRCRIGSVGNVVVRSGKYQDFAVVTMSYWDLRSSAKFRQLMMNGGFMKIYYGKNMYWKAFEYKQRETRVSAPQYVPRTPSYSPPTTITFQDAPQKKGARKPSIDMEEVRVNLEKMALSPGEQDDVLSEISDDSVQYHNGYDVDEPTEKEAGVLLNYNPKYLLQKPPAKRVRVKRAQVSV